MMTDAVGEVPTDPFLHPAFMAAPGQVADWRLVLVYDAARSTGLLEALPATPAAAAGRCGLAPVAARATLDALCAAGVLQADTDGVVAPGPHWPSAAADVQLHQHATTLRRWANSLEARLLGEELPDRGVFQLKEWLQSMAVHAASESDAVAEAALGALQPTRRADAGLSALDLGGGHGRYAAALAARGVHVVMQDRPDVVAVVEQEGWLTGTGVELVAGDFHQQLPDGPFDVVLAVGIMHTMGPQSAAALLARVGTWLRPGGVLLIRTMLRQGSPTASLFAVQMTVAGLGGDTHRLAAYQAWLDAAGLGAPQVTPAGNGSILLAMKP